MLFRSPKNGSIYSCNEGNALDFPTGVQNYLNDCRIKRYSARYIGSLVADFHRNLLKGGIYLYPDTKKSQNGKLRLLYECYPLAYLIEQAGGQALDSNLMNILDIEPLSMHQRTPFFVGSTEMIAELCEQL